MTTDTPAHDLRSALERWPGYDEQSWSQRFAELDRRYSEMQSRMMREIAQYGRITGPLASDTIGNGGGEAEPVAWMYERNGCFVLKKNRTPEYTTPVMGHTETPLYAHPPAAEPVGLRGEVAALRKSLRSLLDACYQADGAEELPDQIDGSLLDAASDALELQYPIIWTDEQVAMLEGRQADASLHPYTCGGDRTDPAHVFHADEAGEEAGLLYPTVRGWKCPACDYRQFWAHETGGPALATPARTDDAAQAVKRIEDGHADTEGEANALFEHLNCPACGGSGHIDDVDTQPGGYAVALEPFDRIREVNRIANMLMATWKRVDPESGVAKAMASYVATFADMARAIVDERALPTQEVEPAAEDRDFRAYVAKAGERLAPHSADPLGSPTRDALVWINAALNPHARKWVALDAPIAPNVPATQAAYPTGAGEGLSADVIALVVAGREAWEAMLSSDADPQACSALDKALERFASRVCYDDDGGDLPEAHANPCTCGAALTPAEARKGEG